MILGDFGTSYAKFLDLDHPDAAPQILETKDLSSDTRVDLATGHNGKRFGHRVINELTALGRGGIALIDDDHFVLLDCGSRDIKFIEFQRNKLGNMGWNAECGASMGFTIELLEHYYNLDYTALKVPEKTFSVTCGVLGMSHIFDAVVAGVPVEEAVAMFVKGIAINAFRFAGAPSRLYLSGGLCDNPLFVASFPCEVISLGRFVLLEGLRTSLAQERV